MSEHSFATRAIHAGQAPDPQTGAIIPPIYQASTHVQDGIGGFRGGYEYNRAGNPTRSSLETQLAALEGGSAALSFASGLAAEDALLRGILKPGDHVVLGNDVYGGTYRLLTRVLAPWGIETSTVALEDADAIRAAIRPETRIVWLETPSNPLLKIVDIAVIAEIAHAAGAVVVVDNTFASPALQQPLALGADLVVHSTTKYLGGHSDVLGGAIVFGDDRHYEPIAFQQFAVGAVSAPLDAWLTTRGIKTLAVRVRQHSENAQAIAEWAAERPEFETVFYPRTRDPPRSRRRRTTDERIRRHAVARAERRTRGRAGVRREHPAVPARGVARRRGVADRLPAGDDACVRAGHGARRPRERGPAVRRHRGRARPHRRSGAGPGARRRLNPIPRSGGQGSSMVGSTFSNRFEPRAPESSLDRFIPPRHPYD